MDPAWREHYEALNRFNAREDEQLRGFRESYADALAWMAEAWDLARRTDPNWRAGGDEQVQHLLRIQTALAKASLSP